MSELSEVYEPNWQSGAAEPEPPEVTSAAERLAGEEDLDLGEVDGTGAGGRITKADVRAAIDQEE